MDTRLQAQPKTKKLSISLTFSGLVWTTEMPRWLPYLILVVSIPALASFFLAPSPLELPMDDSYIHFVYAENLSEHGSLFFNTPGEKGVGDSSLLWVLLLAAGSRVGLSLPWLSKLLGLACLAAVGIGIYHLLKPLLSPWLALGGALLVILSGHMMWFALSGMETLLFLALGILALICYREERWIWLGVFLGLLAITRVEGIILVMVIGAIDILRFKTVRSGMLVAGMLCGLIFLPWILYLWLRTGHFLPTSGIGKHYSLSLSTQLAISRIGALAWLIRLPALIYPLMWFGYAFAFILGGNALPAPYINFTTGAGPLSVNLSVWAILGLVTVIMPLLWICTSRLVEFLRTRDWVNDRRRLPLVIFLIWMILHNLCYMIYLPTIGTASRYASLNHVALWLALGLGVYSVKGTPYKAWLAAGLAIIALANTFYWNRVYDANLEHMLNVRIAAAEYLREQMPGSEACAAFDVGALKYYGQTRLIDLGGLVDPDLVQWFTKGRLDRYLLENRVTCLIIPGRTGLTEDGVVDILKESGLSQSRLFEVQQDRVFQIDRQRWLTGYLPTLNYQATVSIYKLILPDG